MLPPPLRLIGITLHFSHTSSYYCHRCKRASTSTTHTVAVWSIILHCCNKPFPNRRNKLQFPVRGEMFHFHNILRIQRFHLQFLLVGFRLFYLRGLVHNHRRKLDFSILHSISGIQQPTRVISERLSRNVHLQRSHVTVPKLVCCLNSCLLARKSC